MKITRLELTSFGKFQNFALELDGQNTVICKNNEFGKSTLADFICFMLFGFVKNRKRVDLTEDLLQKYLPWEGDKRLCGAMEFVTDEGKELRLEREQNEKGKGQCKLLQNDGETVSSAEDIGETLTGIDRETFWQTFYFRQSAKGLQKTERIDIALKNLVTSGEEQLSFDSVLDTLWEEKKQYQHRGKSGGGIAMTESRIADLSYEIAALEAEAERLGEGLSSREAVRERLAELDADIKKWSKEKEAAKAADAAKKLSRIEQIGQQREACRAQIEALPYQTLLDANLLKKLRAAKEQYSDALLQAETYKTQAEAPDEKLRAVMEVQEAKEPQEKHTLWNIGRVASAVLFVLFAVLSVVWNKAALVAAAVCGILFLCLLRRPLPRKLRKAGIRRKEVAHFVFLAQQWKDAERAQKEKQLQAQAQVGAAAEQMQSALQSVGFSKMGELEQYEACRDKLAALQQRAVMLEEQWNAEAENVDIDALRISAEKGGMSVYSVEECDRNLQDAQRQKAMLLQQTLQTDEKRRKAERRRSEAVEKQYEKEQLMHKLQKDRERNEILTLAMEGLQEAAETLRQSYAPVLQKRAGEKLARITDGVYDTLMVDSQLGIKVKAAGAAREVGYFSEGTADAVYLALRLALAEVVDAKQTLPLILDDPFVSLDAPRRRALCEMLKKASQERQLIFFTCEEAVQAALLK